MRIDPHGISPLNHFTSKYKNFNIKSTKLLHDLDFDSLNASNFYYESIPMAWSVVRYTKKDHSIGNHMTVEENKNFALYCNDVLNNEEPDRSWFKNRTFNGKIDEFIYE